MKQITSLSEFIIKRQEDFQYATGELTRLLSSIALAAKIVHREVNKAGLVNIIGSTGHANIQNEDQKKLDVFANEHFIHALKVHGEAMGIASEENEDIIKCHDDGGNNQGKYVVMIDPLDGSSNIDVNVSIGTIFSIYRRQSTNGLQYEDFLQKGHQQVAAGYVIYGSSTMMVYTTGHGVNGFTLDPSIGVFCLSHPNIHYPKKGLIYSINEGNYYSFPKSIKQYIKYCQRPNRKREYTSRYIGSFVADFHRNLIQGGIYLYPATKTNPQGKLRLLYECNPMAMIAEQAGGMAWSDSMRILDQQASHIHQRTPIYIGSKDMVQDVLKFIQS